MRVEVGAVLKRKSLEKGLEQLVQEGAVQLFRELLGGSAALILGAMGPLQFDVMKHRLKDEYGVELTLTNLPFSLARWPQGEFDPDVFRYSQRIKVVQDHEGRHAILAQSPWDLDRAIDKNDELELAETADPSLFQLES